MIIATFFRFYNIAQMPPGLYPDEAMNGNNALEALSTGNFKIFYPENNGREGLFINIQALSVATFGNEPWALRLVSALFGVLTVLGVYLLTKELFCKKNYESRIMNQELEPENNLHNSKFILHNSKIIALLSSFFLAVSFWHTNFSRIGFRAIMLPFLTTFSFYFLFKGFRTKKNINFIWAGIFMGLGFHTYIAFRIVPIVVIAVLIFKLIEIIRTNGAGDIENSANKKELLKEFFYNIVIYGSFALLAALPIFYYFYIHPDDFIGRAGQVSIFASENPITEVIKSSILTLAQFNFIGDWNWRHNFAGSPLLFWPVGIFFLIGIFICLKKFLKFCYQLLKKFPHNPIPLQHIFLLAWFSAMLAPSILSTEGLPHALRSIGAIPPTFILAGLGTFTLYNFFKKKIFLYSNKKLIMPLYFIILFYVAFSGYRKYFVNYANNPNIKGAFSDNYVKIGRFINNLPGDIKKYVIINSGGALVNNIPMSSQTTMFITNSYKKTDQLEKNIIYLLPNDIKKRNFYDDKSYVIILMEYDDNLTKQLQSLAPGKLEKGEGFNYIIK